MSSISVISNQKWSRLPSPKCKSIPAQQHIHTAGPDGSCFLDSGVQPERTNFAWYTKQDVRLFVTAADGLYKGCPTVVNADFSNSQACLGGHSDLKENLLGILSMFGRHLDLVWLSGPPLCFPGASSHALLPPQVTAGIQGSKPTCGSSS